MIVNPLKDEQALLNAIIMSSDDAIVSKSLDGIITSWNPAAVQMFGYTQEDVVGRHISLIIPEDRLSEEDYIISQIRAGNQVNHFETIRKTQSGDLIPISVTVSPVIDSNGNIIGASKIARNISEKYKVQQEKTELLEQLKELNQRKDEFIALASHELRTPLTSMNGYLHILSKKITDENIRQFAEKAICQTKKLEGLISDLLDVSRIEAGKLTLRKEIFEICELVKQTIDIISHANTDFIFNLNTVVESQTYIGDAQRLEQVLVNLLTNAIRYSGGNNKIEISLLKENGYLKIGVKDYGLGIEPENLEHIFSRFYRADNNDRISGLGLGLYLCHQIVSQHEGKIWAESEISKGSTFWVQLPLSKN